MRKLMGDDAINLFTGAVVAEPGAADQPLHMDGGHLWQGTHGFEQPQCPPHCYNVFLPLVDVTAENGPTEFWPGSHVIGKARDAYDGGEPGVALAGAVGDIIVFDYRVVHRGMANAASAARPVLYSTFSRPWFRDALNFRTTRSSAPRAAAAAAGSAAAAARQKEAREEEAVRLSGSKIILTRRSRPRPLRPSSASASADRQARRPMTAQPAASAAAARRERRRAQSLVRRGRAARHDGERVGARGRSLGPNRHTNPARTRPRVRAGRPPRRRTMSASICAGSSARRRRGIGWPGVGRARVSGSGRRQRASSRDNQRSTCRRCASRVCRKSNSDLGGLGSDDAR